MYRMSDHTTLCFFKRAIDRSIVRIVRRPCPRGWMSMDVDGIHRSQLVVCVPTPSIGLEVSTG